MRYEAELRNLQEHWPGWQQLPWKTNVHRGANFYRQTQTLIQLLHDPLQRGRCWFFNRMFHWLHKLCVGLGVGPLAHSVTSRSCKCAVLCSWYDVSAINIVPMRHESGAHDMSFSFAKFEIDYDRAKDKLKQSSDAWVHQCYYSRYGQVTLSVRPAGSFSGGKVVQHGRSSVLLLSSNSTRFLEVEPGRCYTLCRMFERARALRHRTRSRASTHLIARRAARARVT